MKKLTTLLAVLLLGVGSVFAGPYEVLVSWSYVTPFYCQSELTNEYVFVITLKIYDIVNEVEFTDTYNIEDWDETETLFDEAQTQIEDWCDKATSTPYLRVTARASMVHQTTQEVYCWREGIAYRTCNQFSGTGVEIPLEFD